MTTFRPVTLQEALEIRAAGPSCVVAGGSDLMVRHRRGAGIPPTLTAAPLFIGHLPEIRGVSREGGGIRIGAATTLMELLGNRAIPGAMKSLLREFAAPGVRGSATIGGNICNASPAADLAPFLYAHDALVTCVSARETREIPIERFISGPGATGLGSDEIVTAVFIPTESVAGTAMSWYRKVALRRSNALSKLSVYCSATATPDRLSSCAVAIGAVAPTVIRDRGAEASLAGVSGAELTSATGAVRTYLDTVSALIDPIDDQRSTAVYRRETALRLLEYLLLTVVPQFMEEL